MKKLNILRGILALFFVLLLTACSGGGDGDSPPTPSTEGVWDQMNWNEKNWQ